MTRGDLYLGPDRSGARWLFDPDNPEVTRLLTEAQTHTHDSLVDPIALAEDLPTLLTLIRERHFGVATGSRDASELPALLDAWTARLRAEQPNTWGTALAPEAQQLRNLLRDSHFRFTGEDQRPPGARSEPRLDPHEARDESHPIVEWREIGDVLYIRLRRLYGSLAELDQLREWSARGGEQFRSHRRIVLDVRGNPGGDDSWTWLWMHEHLPFDYAGWHGSVWCIGGEPLIYWNAIIASGAEVSPEWSAHRPVLGPEVELELQRDDDDDHESGSPRPGGLPWNGRMVVITDRGTGSSGESTAWRLKLGFDATIAGASSYGAIAYGNVTPYLLPRSGGLVHLVSMGGDLEPYEMIGLPVDLELDVTKPIGELLPHIAAYLGGEPGH